MVSRQMTQGFSSLSEDWIEVRVSWRTWDLMSAGLASSGRGIGGSAIL